MCLTLPMQVKRIANGKTYVDDKKSERLVKIGFTDQVKKGDWLLVNADLAINKVTAKEAQDLKKLLNK